MFQITIKLTDEESDFDNRDTDGKLRPLQNVDSGGQVRVRYADDGRRRPIVTLRVETTSPVISNLSPAHNSGGSEAQPRVTADVTDSRSGVVQDRIYVVFALVEDGVVQSPLDSTGLGGAHVVNVEETGGGRFSDITAGYGIEMETPNELDVDDDARPSVVGDRPRTRPATSRSQTRTQTPIAGATQRSSLG